jgi:hypothetical protein
VIIAFRNTPRVLPGSRSLKSEDAERTTKNIFIFVPQCAFKYFFQRARRKTRAQTRAQKSIKKRVLGRVAHTSVCMLVCGDRKSRKILKTRDHRYFETCGVPPGSCSLKSKAKNDL